MNKQEKFEKVIEWFSANMPFPKTELTYKDSYQLLVAVILSAQCTDKRVNMITPAFFERFPDADILAASGVDEIYQYIKSCSFPNSKAKNLSGMAKAVVTKYGGVLPGDSDELQKIPGVGRKTANIILSTIFNKPALAVDTHVFRVAARLGLTTNAKTPLDTEVQLLKYIPVQYVSKFHHWLILHGRYVCTARSPKCMKCGLRDLCVYYNTKVVKSVI
jgi:endonuclease-3